MFLGRASSCGGSASICGCVLWLVLFSHTCRVGCWTGPRHSPTILLPHRSSRVLDKMKYNSDGPLLASLGTSRGKSELRRAQSSPSRSDKVEKHWISHSPPPMSLCDFCATVGFCHFPGEKDTATEEPGSPVKSTPASPVQSPTKAGTKSPAVSPSKASEGEWSWQVSKDICEGSGWSVTHCGELLIIGKGL